MIQQCAQVVDVEQASMATVGYIFEAGFTDSTTPFSVLCSSLSCGVRKPKPLWRLK